MELIVSESRDVRFGLTLLLLLIVCSTRNVGALELCSSQLCEYAKGCQCPLTIPNEQNVQNNPMTVMITGSGHINATFITYLERSLHGLVNPQKCPPQVTLFFDVMSMTDSELHKAITTAKNGRLVYDYGIYGKANVDDVEKWKNVVSTSRNRLQKELRAVKSKSKVTVFRAANFEWTDNMFSALDELGVLRDFSYVTRQPLWPFTLAYKSDLCYEKLKDVPLESLGYTHLCPGRFKNIWVIPNNALFTMSNGSESRLHNCTWLSDCLSSALSANQSLEDLLTVNYQRRSTSKGKLNNYWQSREPFVINLRADFFWNFVGGEENGIATLNKALKVALSSVVGIDNSVNKAAYFVHASDLVKWMTVQATNKQIASGFSEVILFKCKTKHTHCESAFIYIPGAIVMLQVLIYILFLAWAICNSCYRCFRKCNSCCNCCRNCCSGSCNSRLNALQSCLDKLIVRKYVTVIGSLVTGTIVDGYWLQTVFGSPDQLPQEQQNRTTQYVAMTNRRAPAEEKSKKSMPFKIFLRSLVTVGWFACRGIVFAGMVAGPIRLWKEGVSTNDKWKTPQGFDFVYVLGLQTVLACVYWALSLLVSLRIQQGHQELNAFDNNNKSLCCHSKKSSWGSYAGCSLVTLVYITNVICMSIGYGEKHSTVGWYSTFSCDTALMYLSFYFTLFLMAHVSLLFSFSLDRWCESYLHLLAEMQRDPNEATKGALKDLIKAYKRYYTGFKSLFLLVVVQLPAGYLPMYWFAQYLRETLAHLDKTARVLRISLLISLMIVDVVPYVATWLTQKWVKRRYGELTNGQTSSKNRSLEEFQNGKVEETKEEEKETEEEEEKIDEKRDNQEPEIKEEEETKEEKDEDKKMKEEDEKMKEEDYSLPNSDEYLNKGQFVIQLTTKAAQVISFLSLY